MSANKKIIELVIDKAGSQVELARKLGVSQALVSRWANGYRVPANRAIDIEKIFGFSRSRLRPDIFES